MEENNKDYRELYPWLPKPFEKGMLIIAGVVILVAIIMGIIGHNMVTPFPEGTYVGKAISFEDGSVVKDNIVVKEDHTVSISRIVELADGSGQEAHLRGVGKWSEKKDYFLIKWKSSDAEFVTDVYKTNGKPYRARSFVDNKIRIHKNGLNLYYKRKGEWVASSIGCESKHLQSSTTESRRQKNLNEVTTAAPLGYKLYDVPSKFSVVYPSYMKPDVESGDNYTKVVFSSVEKGITLTAEIYEESVIPSIKNLYDDMLEKRSKGGSITYNMLKDNHYVISGRDNRGKIFYRRGSVEGKSKYCIELLYPEIWQESADRLIASFPDYPRMNSLLYSGKLIDGSKSYPISLRLFVKEDEIVSGYYWYKKYKESNHTSFSGSLEGTKPQTLVLTSAKGTEVFRFVSPVEDSFNCDSGLSGKWFKYESGEARTAGADPVKIYSIILK